MNNWEFLKRVVRHKWYVLVAGLRLGGIPLWRLLVHDLSKFSPTEWRGQVARGGDDNRPMSRINKTIWGEAWIHHKNHNPHHWEYWRIDGNIRKGWYPQDYIVDGFVAMPMVFVREMVADMMGASREYTGDYLFQKFLDNNYHRFQLHPKNIKIFVEVLAEIGLNIL